MFMSMTKDGLDFDVGYFLPRPVEKGLLVLRDELTQAKRGDTRPEAHSHPNPNSLHG